MNQCKCGSCGKTVAYRDDMAGTTGYCVYCYQLVEYPPLVAWSFPVAEQVPNVTPQRPNPIGPDGRYIPIPKGMPFPDANTQVVVIVNQRSKVVACVLSLIVPGLGQIYCGKAAVGIAWFFVVLVGYVLYFIPGFVLHIVCIATAPD